jgi:hypothetical protein
MDRDEATIEWLLASDPAVRWQVMRDLLDAPEEVLRAERARIPSEGWGAQLLATQQADGTWAPPDARRDWPYNLYTLHLLRAFEPDPSAAPIRAAIERTRDHVTWGAEFGNSPFFAGEVEPCINGMVLSIGSYFGEPDDALAARLLEQQQSDGGWNCDAPASTRGSFHTSIDVLEGLTDYRRAGGDIDVASALDRGHEFLLERRMFKRRSTGEVIDPTWTHFAFPYRYSYDLLRGLDHLRDAGAAADDRIEDAVTVLEERADDAGRWVLTNPELEDPQVDIESGNGKPSRWNTLRALRVLRWAGR